MLSKVQHVTKQHIQSNGVFWQLFKYGIIGLIAFSFDLSVYLGLTRLGGLPPLPANLISGVIGMIIVFALNRRHTFSATKGDVAVQTRRFLLVSLMNYWLQQALLWVFLRWTLLNLLGTWHDVGAKVLAISLVVLSNFTLHRLWSFRDSSRDPANS